MFHLTKPSVFAHIAFYNTLMRGVFLSLVVVIAGLSAQASTVRVTVDSNIYDVSTVYTDYASSQTLLESQAWWGNSDLAKDFADAVAFSFGGVNYYGEEGPYFLFDSNFTFAYSDYFGGVYTYSYGVDYYLTYATATQVSAVPLPAGGFLIFIGIAGFAAIRRRKKSMM